MASKYPSPEFSMNSTVRFKWKPGAGVELCRSTGVGKEIKLHTDRAFQKANSMTPRYEKMTNPNYFTETKLAGKRNMWRGRVWCGNIASQRHDLKTNTLLKALSGA